MIESLFGYEVGDPILNITVGVCLLTWVLIARVFMAMFPTKRGIIAAFLSLAVPLLIGLLAYGMAELHIVPMVEADWADPVLPWVGFAFFLLFAIILIAKRILDLSAGVAIFIYIVATSASIGAYFGVQVTTGVIEFGEEQVEQRDQRVNDEIDSLL